MSESTTTPQPWKLHTPLPPDVALQRLDEAARRGRLPGFAPQTGGDGFRLAAFGRPFDRVVIARLEPAPHGGTYVHLRTRLSWPLPLAFAIVLAGTVWPGVWLTDSMLRTYFAFYDGWVTAGPLATWMWYLPLCAPLPWAYVHLLRRSEQAARCAARDAIRRVAAELSAIDADDTPPSG